MGFRYSWGQWTSLIEIPFRYQGQLCTEEKDERGRPSPPSP